MRTQLIKEELGLIEMKKTLTQRGILKIGLSHVEEAEGLCPMHLIPGSKP